MKEGKREETREYRGGSEQLDFYGRQIIKAAADPSDGGGVLKRCTGLLAAYHTSSGHYSLNLGQISSCSPANQSCVNAKQGGGLSSCHYD